MKKNTALEFVAYFLTLSVLFYDLWDFLCAKTTYLHDNLYWDVPLFHFFADSLLNGHLPLWNPYEHGGEPFYPLLGVPRLFDPIDSITVLAGGAFTHNLLLLAHWARIAKTIAVLTGAYLCIRPWSKSLAGRIAFLPILFFSYFAIGSFRQQAHLALFASVPWVIFFLQRIVFFDDRRMFNWLALGAFLGLNWQFYHFASIWVFLLFFILGLLLFYREGIGRLWDKRLIASALVCLGMMGPFLFLLHTQDRYVYPPRMLPKDYESRRSIRSPENIERGPDSFMPGVRIPYSAAYYSGTVGTLETLLQALVPDAAYFSNGNISPKWRFYADSSSYLGILVWGLALIGLCLDGRNPFRKVWGICFFATALFVLGKGGGVQQLLYYVYPPVSAFRHTRIYMAVALFPLLILAARGFEIECRRLWPSGLSLAYGGLVAALLIFAMKVVDADWAWTVLIPSGLLFYWGLRKVAPETRFWSLFLGTGVAAGTLAPNFLVYLLFALVAFLVFLTWQWRKWGVWIMVLFLFFDYHHHLKKNSLLYESPIPLTEIGVDLEARKPVFQEARYLYAANIGVDPQSIRYLATLYRRATAFSTPMGDPEEIDSFARILGSQRWTSFLLPRTYFELIHSDIPVEKLERAFAIGSSTLLFEGPKGKAWRREVLDYNPNKLVVRIRNEGKGTLFWSDGYAPEWKATVDGKPVPISLAWGHFKSVPVPEGDHVVEFKYEPLLFLISGALFYLSFFGALIWVPVAASLSLLINLKAKTYSIPRFWDNNGQCT